MPCTQVMVRWLQSSQQHYLFPPNRGSLECQLSVPAWCPFSIQIAHLYHQLTVAVYRGRHMYPVMGTKPDKRLSTHKLSKSLMSCPSMSDSGQANNKKEPLSTCIRAVKCEYCSDCSTLNACFPVVEGLWEYTGCISDLRIQILLYPVLPGQQKTKTQQSALLTGAQSRQNPLTVKTEYLLSSSASPAGNCRKSYTC